MAQGEQQVEAPYGRLPPRRDCRGLVIASVLGTGACLDKETLMGQKQLLKKLL